MLRLENQRWNVGDPFLMGAPSWSGNNNLTHCGCSVMTHFIVDAACPTFTHFDLPH